MQGDDVLGQTIELLWVIILIWLITCTVVVVVSLRYSVPFGRDPSVHEIVENTLDFHT